MRYEVNTNGFKSTVAREAAAVACRKKRAGEQVNLFVVGETIDGRHVCHEVPVTTVKETTRDLVSASQLAQSRHFKRKIGV